MKPVPIRLLCALALFLTSCATVPVTREIRNVEEISSMSASSSYLKAHIKDGSVYVLYEWRAHTEESTITGFGRYLDLNRKVIEERLKPKKNATDLIPFEIPFERIALVETNDPGTSIAGGLTFMTGVTTVVAVICLTNPKACFGSCPTFYASNGDSLVLMAEGFSTSVSPSLEKSDVDMLYHAQSTKNFELLVTNEALETHSICSADILAFERKAGERVFATSGDEFYRCHDLVGPTAVEGVTEADLSDFLVADDKEYYSLADADNLCSKEELIFSFNSESPSAQKGLVIGKRQTLLTTYLMYQGLAYMGGGVGYWMAEQERKGFDAGESIFSLLGGIEVYAESPEGNWQQCDVIHETGPIATDFNMVLLPNLQAGAVRLKLKMNKGLWRIDYLALANIEGKAEPVIVEPCRLEPLVGQEEDALARLLNDDEYLVTMPGDAYTIHYELPFESAEIFLRSRGYYLEWIRDEWAKEQNFKKLNLMVNKPELFLKRAAKDYKLIEPTMEETFWNSRYVKN